MENQEKVDKPSYGFGVKFAVISLIIIQFTQAFASPALASIQASFPNVDTTIIQQVVALPTMLMVFSSLFCGRLCAWIGYRKSSYIAITLSLLGGVMPAIMHSSIGIVLFWRGVFGLGYGLVFALCIASINVLWSGKEQKMMMGVMTGVGAACAMAYSALSGYLAEFSWTYVFWAYLVIIPFAIVIIAKLPEPPKREAPKNITQTEKGSGGFGAVYFIFVILACLSVAFTASFMNNSAMVIIGSGMGTPTDVGVTMTWFSLGMAVGGFIYAGIKRLTGRFILPLLFILFGLTTCLMCNTLNLAVFMAAAAVYGALFGMINPEYNTMSGTTVRSKARTADGASIYIALQGVGQFIGPFLLAGLAGIVGFTGVYYQLNVSWPILLITGIILGIAFIFKKRDLTVPKYTDEFIHPEPKDSSVINS